MVAEAIKRIPRARGQIYRSASFRSRDSVGALIGLTRKALVEDFDRGLAPLGLNTAQALVLVFLVDERAGTAAEVCKHLSHDPGAMTRLIDKLEAMGLVRRGRARDDRRSARLEITARGTQGHGDKTARGVRARAARRGTLLEITARGRQVHADMTRVQIDMLNRALRGFSSAEARTLEGLLRRVLHNVAGE